MACDAPALGIHQPQLQRHGLGGIGRSLQIQPHPQAGAGDRANALPGLHRLEISLQFEHVVRERVGRMMVAAQRTHRGLVGARRPAEPQVDASGVQRLERAELLGDDQRRVVRQHHAAGAHAHRLRAAGDVADDDRGGRAGDPGHVVMFGHPVAPVAQALAMLRQLERMAQRVGGGVADADRHEVED